ncbi:MAG: phage tail protein [Acidobacteriota bacterium]
MSVDRADPFINARFRVEIDGFPAAGAAEIIFPEARIVAGPRKTRVVTYGPLILRRGMTRSPEWYQWWDRARTSSNPDRRNINVVLMDASHEDVTRWSFSAALPSGYCVSPLNALGAQPLIETLELSVAGLHVAFGDAAKTGPDRRRNVTTRKRA